MKIQEKIIVIISLSLIAIAGLGYLLLPLILDRLNPPNENFIGLAVDVKDDVKIRFGDSINWKTLSNNEKIFSNSYLYTGENASARFIFLDKSSITLTKNSLVHLNFDVSKANLKNPQKNKNLNIDLVDGKAALALKKNSVVNRVKIKDTEVEISKDEESTIGIENTESFGVKTAVYSGSASISAKGQKYNVKAGEKISVNKENKVEKKPVTEKELEQLARMSRDLDQQKKYVFENRRSFITIFREMAEVFQSE